MSPTNVHRATLVSLEYSRKVNESAVVMVRSSLAYDRRNSVERTLNCGQKSLLQEKNSACDAVCFQGLCASSTLITSMLLVDPIPQSTMFIISKRSAQ